MKKLLSVVLLSTLFSCNEYTKPTPLNNKDSIKIDLKEFKPFLETIEIDSCEYLFGDWKEATVLTHKGNCKNPIHFKQPKQ